MRITIKENTIHKRLYQLILIFLSFQVLTFSSDTLQVNINSECIHVQRILVVYYSRSGNTKEIAQQIASRLNAEIEEINDNKDRSGLQGLETCDKDVRLKTIENLTELKKNPKDYDLVIIGSPIWNGTISTPVSSFVIKYKDRLPDKIGFFTTGRWQNSDNPEKEIAKLLGRNPITSIGFISTKGDLGQKKKFVKTEKFIQSLKARIKCNEDRGIRK